MSESDRGSLRLAPEPARAPLAADAAHVDTVVVAADNALTRFAIRRALEDGGFVVCAEAGDLAGAVEAALRERPDVCLLELHMPGNVIEAIEAIVSGSENTAVVALTVARNDPNLFQALCAGATGYVPEDIDPERIPSALRNVLEGEIALPRSVVKEFVAEFHARHSQRLLRLRADGRARLTEREWEVLDLLRQGLSTAEVAKRLFISQVTVRTHVRSIVKKLSVPDRSAAIRLLEQALRARTR